MKIDKPETKQVNKKEASLLSNFTGASKGDFECYLMECFNLFKNTKEFFVFEYKIESTINESEYLPLLRAEFYGFSLYKKEHKTIFEIAVEEDALEPTSTFNLNIKENEAEAKKNVILPYLKENNEELNTVIDSNLIQVGMDDLNELYEEDPDEDLDI